MTHDPSPKAPPRPFLAAAPETRTLIARMEELAGSAEAFPFETQAPADWARIGFAAQNEAERRSVLEAAVHLLMKRPDLEAFHQHGVSFRRRAAGPGKIAALFGCEEEAHPGMGAALMAGFPRSASVARNFDRMFEALGDPSLTEVVLGADPRVSARLRSPVYGQLGAAALAAGQYAVLRAGGFTPDMFAGYGSGEVAALWAAGAMEEETFGALLYARASAMTAPDLRRPSANLRVYAPIEGSLDLIGESGLRVFVARHEAPKSHVVGGEVEELEAFSARLLGRGIAHEALPGALAYHSARAELAAATFAGALSRARLGEPRLPVYGAELAAPYGPGEIVERLSRQLLRPLRFQETVERMHADGARIFVEFGPGDALTRRVKAILEGRPHLAVALDSGEPELSARRVMEAAANLAAAGAPFKGERPPPPKPQPIAEPSRPLVVQAEPVEEARRVEPAPQPELEAEAPLLAAPPAESVPEPIQEPVAQPIMAPIMADEPFAEEPPPSVGLLQAEMAEEEAIEEPPAAEEKPLEASSAPVAPEVAPEAEAKIEEAQPEPQAESSVETAEAEAEEAAEEAEATAQAEAPAETAPEPEAEEAPEAAASEAAEEPEAVAEEASAPPPAPEPPAPPAEPPAPPAPLTGAALALRLAEQVTTAHALFLENQTAALRALLEASADPEALFAIEEARREAAESHRLYLEGIAALGGVRPALAVGSAPVAAPVAAPALAALAALEAEHPPAPEPAEEAPYVDPPERFAAFRAAPQPEPLPVLHFEDAAPDLLQAEAEQEALKPEEAAPAPLAAAAEPEPEPAPEPEAAPEPEPIPLLAAEAEPEPEPKIEAEPEAEPAADPLPLAAEAEPQAAAPPQNPTAHPTAHPTANLPALRAPQALAVIPGSEAPEVGSGLAVVGPADFGDDSALTRLAFHLAPISAPPLRQANPGEARWLIVGDADFAAALVKSLKREAGDAPCATVTTAADVGALELFGQGGPWTGVVYLHASGEEERIALGRLEIARSLAEAAQEAFHDAAARGERRVFAAMARLDGALGYGPEPMEGLGASAFGLVKALAAAEPNFFCRAVDLAADLPQDQAADLLAAELYDADRGRAEVAVSAEGRFEALPFLEPTISADQEEGGEVFVLLGDARGVATLWMEEAAARAPRRFLLLGTHRLLPDEPAWAIGIKSEESLRWAAFQALEAEGADEERAAVGAVALSEAVVADRETRACLAELRRLGSEAAYATVDFDASGAADQIASYLEEAGDGPVSVFYAPTSEAGADFSSAYRRRLRRVETLMDAFSGADLRRIWFLPTALDASESLSEAMADEAVRRFAMGARAMGIDVRALLWALAEEVEPGVVAALAEELRRPALGLGLTLIGGGETALSLRRIDPGALTAGGAFLKADWSALFASAAATRGESPKASSLAASEEPPALSAAFALAAAFAAVERFAPGWRAQGCDGVSLANGVALGGGESGWILLGLRSAEWIDATALRADLEIFDASGSARLKIEGARFSTHPPAAAEIQPPVAPPQDCAAALYEEGSLTGAPARGSDLRLLEAFRMEEGAEEGLFVLSAEVEVAGTERAALLDPVLAEAMVQSALAATRRRAGKSGALMRLEALFVRDGDSGLGPLLVEARLRRDSARAAVWRLTARTAAGAALMACDAAVILGAPPAIRLAPHEAEAGAAASAQSA